MAKVYIYGNNDLKAREMFVQRNTYDIFALSALEKVKTPQLETIQIKDFIKDEKLLIGRVDAQGNPILIDSRMLKSFTSTVGGAQGVAANFVVDAFKDMQAEFSHALRVGKIDTDSPALSELTVKKAYTDPTDGYLKYRDTKIEVFKRFVLRKGRIDKIKDFETFVPIFMEFVEASAADNPFTETMFILVKRNSVLASGLAVEIYEGDYGDDASKIDLFYKDINFEYLKNLAYGHGFVIDKHIPWRLVADMNSPQMTPYIGKSLGLAGDNFGAGIALTLMFNRPHFDGIESISDMMVKSYNAIARMRPRTVKKMSSATSSPDSSMTVFRKCSTRSIINRRLTSLRGASVYPMSYWLDKYVRIRNAETGLKYDDATLNIIIKNATDLINSLDIFATMRYIASKFDNVEHFGGSLFHDVVRFEMREDPSATGASVDERVQRSVQASNFVVY
jgi:hypothetical protein